jgi:hypothetical protein
MTDQIDIHFVFDSPASPCLVAELFESCCESISPSSDADGDSSVTTRDTLAAGGKSEFRFHDLVFLVRVNPADEVFPSLPHFQLGIPERYFRPRQGLNSTEDVLSHSSQLVELTAELYEQLVTRGQPPQYVCGLGPGDIEVLTNPVYEETITEEAVLDGQVEFVGWLQIYPPETVADVGVESFRTAPASQVEMMPNGGVLLVADTSPTMIESNYDPDAIAEHLWG